MRFIQLRSAPAQKATPAPASTMSRTVSSCSISRNVRVRSAIRTSSKALRTSGRFSVTMATVLRFSTIRFSDIGLSGDAGFEDDFAFHRIRDKAAFVGLLMQLRKLLGSGLRARKCNHRTERNGRHRLPALGVLGEHAGRLVAVVLDD